MVIFNVLSELTFHDIILVSKQMELKDQQVIFLILKQCFLF